MLGDLLSPSVIASRGYFHPAGVKRFIQHHLKGVADHTHILWALLMLEMWFREMQPLNAPR